MAPKRTKQEILYILMYTALILITIIATHFLSRIKQPRNGKDWINKSPITEPAAFSSLAASAQLLAPFVANAWVIAPQASPHIHTAA